MLVNILEYLCVDRIPRNLLSIVQTRRLAANSTLNPDKLHQLQQNHPIQAPWVERKEKQKKIKNHIISVSF